MDAWIEHTLDDDPLAAESWAELLEACPTDSEEFMPTKTPPPKASPRQKRVQYQQPVPIEPPTTDKPLYLLDSYDWARASGDVVKLGRCPMCGRNVTRSMCNKTGARCRYEGAQFDASGKMVNKPWEAKPEPSRAHFSTNIVHHYFNPSLRSQMPDEAALLGTAYVFGVPYHFCFIEVTVGDDGGYDAVYDPFNRLPDVEKLYEGQPLRLTEIDGKQYIGFAHPHGS